MVVHVVLPNYFLPMEQYLVREGVLEWESALNGLLVVEWAKDPDREVFDNLQTIRTNGWADEDDSALESDTWTGCSNVVVFVRALSSDPEPAKRKDWHAWTRSSCHVKYVVMVMDMARTSEQFQNTVAHEFGHIIGLSHVFQKNVSIMYPFAGAGAETKCVSLFDRRSFGIRWGYDWAGTKDPDNCRE
jgi:hypothetical protein